MNLFLPARGREWLKVPLPKLETKEARPNRGELLKQISQEARRGHEWLWSGKSFQLPGAYTSLDHSHKAEIQTAHASVQSMQPKACYQVIKHYVRGHTVSAKLSSPRLCMIAFSGLCNGGRVSRNVTTRAIMVSVASHCDVNIRKASRLVSESLITLLLCCFALHTRKSKIGGTSSVSTASIFFQ